MEEQREKLCEGRFELISNLSIQGQNWPPIPLERISSVPYLSCAVQF